MMATGRNIIQFKLCLPVWLKLLWHMLVQEKYCKYVLPHLYTTRRKSFSSTVNAFVKSYSLISSRTRLHPNCSLICGNREVGHVTVPSMSMPKRRFLIPLSHLAGEVLPVFSFQNILPQVCRFRFLILQPSLLPVLCEPFSLS